MSALSSRSNKLSQVLIGNRLVPWSIGFLCAILVIGFWIKLVQVDREEHQAILEANANWMVSEVTGQLEPLALALIRMAHRAALRDTMTQAEWTADAHLYANHFPGYLAILWLEADGTVRWSQQPDQVPERYAEVPAVQALLDASLTTCPLTDAPQALCTFTVPEAGLGLTIWAPIVRNRTTEGYMVGIFDARDALAPPVVPDFSPYHGGSPA